MTLELLTIAVRTALYVDLLPLFGVAAFGLHGLRASERAAGVVPLRSWIVAMALLGLIFSSVQIIVMAASMAGIPPSAVDESILGQLINGTPVGAAWKARILALSAMLPVLYLLPRRATATLILATGLAGIACGSLAWTGHGAMDEGLVGWIHLFADIVHLLAAGAWIGAILSLVWLLFDARAATGTHGRLILLQHALNGFAATGSLIVALILGTGVVNGWILLGARNILLLPADLYGRLLLIKIAFFVAMLGLAAANRFSLTPALGRAALQGEPGEALAALRWSLVCEGGCALAILAIVAWLGILDPTNANISME